MPEVAKKQGPAISVTLVDQSNVWQTVLKDNVERNVSRVTDAMRKQPRSKFIDPNWIKLLASQRDFVSDIFKAAGLSRDDFTPDEANRKAVEWFADNVPKPLPMGPVESHGRISAPDMVWTMLGAADIQDDMHCLVVGGGTGWVTSMVAELVGKRGSVTSIEIDPAIYEFGKSNIKKLRCANIEFIKGNGTKGYKKNAPYDRIVVCAASLRDGEKFTVPAELFKQLKEGGRMIIPICDETTDGKIVCIQKTEGVPVALSVNNVFWSHLVGEYEKLDIGEPKEAFAEALKKFDLSFVSL